MEQNTFWILATRNDSQIYLMALNELLNYVIGTLPSCDTTEESETVRTLVERINGLQQKIGISIVPLTNVKISTEDALLLHYALSRLALKFKIQISLYQYLLEYNRLIQKTLQPHHYSSTWFSDQPYDELVAALNDIEKLCQRFSDELDDHSIVIGRIIQHYYNRAEKSGCTFSMIVRETPSFLEIQHIPNDTKYDLGNGYMAAWEVPDILSMNSNQKKQKVKKHRIEYDNAHTLYGYSVWNGIPTRYFDND